MQEEVFMRVLSVLFGLFFSYTVFAESAVCLYSEINYGGNEKCIDSMNGAGSRIRLSDFNDRAKSVRVFPGFNILFHEHNDTPGKYFELNRDTPDLGANKNLISSLSISTDATLSGYIACFWSHENYHGQRLCIRDMTSVDLAAYGLNDKVSSVKVRSGYSLHLYQHVNFSGNVVTLAGNVPNLGSFNDVASSAKAFSSSATTTLAIGSDPQLYCTKNCSQEITEAAAAQKVKNSLALMVANSDVNAIFINGDLTEYGHPREWSAFFDTLSHIRGKTAVYWGLGNHDYINNNHDTYQNRGYVHSMVNMWNHLTNLTSSVYDARVTTNRDWVIHGSLGYAVDLGDVYYIQLNDQQVDAGYWDSKNQDYDTYDYNDTTGLCCSFYGSNLSSAKTFLQQQLEFAAQHDKVVVIGKHRPTLSPDMAELIKSYNVKLLFAGHYHNIETNFDKGLTFYNSGSMAKGSYLKLTVNKTQRTAHIVSNKTNDGVDYGTINEVIELPVVSPKYQLGQGLLVR